MKFLVLLYYAASESSIDAGTAKWKKQLNIILQVIFRHVATARFGISPNEKEKRKRKKNKWNNFAVSLASGKLLRNNRNLQQWIFSVAVAAANANYKGQSTQLRLANKSEVFTSYGVSNAMQKIKVS